MLLNNLLSKKATQTREEAISFENSLKIEFENLNIKSNENVIRINEQLDLLKQTGELENEIANKIGIIAALFSKNALLENLFNNKLEEKLSKFPKKTEEELKESITPPSTPSTTTQPPVKMAAGGVVPGAVQQRRKDKEIIPYSQTLTLPLRASGIAALSVLGDFIKGTGALGGFFAPYVKSVVRPFSLAMGVGDNIINTLLGGPVQAATLDLKKQQREFGKMWGKFLNDPDFVDQYIDREGGLFGAEDDTPYTGEWGPILDLIKKVEAVTYKYNAVNYGSGPGVIPGLTEMTIKQADAAAAEYHRKYPDSSGALGQYQFMSPISQAKEAGLNPDTDKFSPANQDKMAVNIIENKRRGKDWKDRKIGDDEFMKLLAAEWRGLPAGPDGKTYQDEAASRNAAHASWQEFKDAIKKVKGGSFARGGQQGKMTTPLTPYLISGSESGFDTHIQGMPVTLHGTEIVVPTEDGAQVYPVKNRRYDIYKDPLGVVERWGEIARGSNTQNVSAFSAGGTADFWKVAALTSKEDSLHPQGQADVAQALYNRAAIGSYPGGKSLGAIVTAPGQFEPTFHNAGAWAAIRDRKSAIAAAGSAQKVDMAVKSITNPSLQKEAQKFVGGRTDFMGESQKPHMKPGDVTRGPGYNFHGWFYDAKLPKAAPVPRTIATPNKPASAVVVNRVGSGSQPNIIQQTQGAIMQFTNMIFNPHKVKRELNLKRV